MTQIHTFSSTEAMSEWWKYTRKYFWIITGLAFFTMVPSVLNALIQGFMVFLPGAIETITDPATGQEIRDFVWPYFIVSIVVSILSFIFQTQLQYWFIKISMMIVQDIKPTIKNMFISWMVILRISVAWILVFFLSVLWLICFIIPGIYILYRLSMVSYLIIEGYGIIDAMKTSRVITEGNVWSMIKLWFWSFWIILLGFWVILLGLLWAIPTVILARVRVYLQLKKNIPQSDNIIEAL